MSNLKVWSHTTNHIGGEMVSMLAFRGVDCWFEPLSDPTKNYKIGMCYLSAKHTA